MYLNTISNTTLLFIAGGGGGATFTGGTTYVAGQTLCVPYDVHMRALA